MGAVGFDFFQGPRVVSPNDTAIVHGFRVGGFKNLPMTAFFYFINGDQFLADPTLKDLAGSTQMYNFIRGRIGLTGQLFQDPQGNSTTFALTGDPQANKGWIDGAQFPPGDRRMGLASGPFTMAPGDTQEIVVAEIAAGAIPGVDRLSAVGLLKFFDKVAQQSYDNNFQLPSPPPPPNVQVSELSNEIVLNWGTNPAQVAATENSDVHGFKFQGYNVYQLPSASATITQAKRIATFDVSGDGITRITDQVFDPSTGAVTPKIVQFGTDSGLQHYLNVTGDAFNGGNPLINGIRYYFAVTAYSYSPDPNAVPNNLENLRPQHFLEPLYTSGTQQESASPVNRNPSGSLAVDRALIGGFDVGNADTAAYGRRTRSHRARRRRGRGEFRRELPGKRSAELDAGAWRRLRRDKEEEKTGSRRLLIS